MASAPNTNDRIYKTLSCIHDGKGRDKAINHAYRLLKHGFAEAAGQLAEIIF